MTLLPIFISILALLLSVLSFVLSLRAYAVNQKTELEQLRSEISFKLTAQSIHIIEHADKLLDFQTSLLKCAEGERELFDNAAAANIMATLQQLTSIAEGLNKLREKLERLEIPSNIFWPSHLKAHLIGLRGALEEFELVRNRLSKELKEPENLNAGRVLQITTGLLSRLGYELNDRSTGAKL